MSEVGYRTAKIGGTTSYKTCERCGIVLTFTLATSLASF